MPIRTPEERYQGRVGQTRKTSLHYVCPTGERLSASVYRQVNAGTDPELARKLLEVAPDRTLNTVKSPSTGDYFYIHVPVVYHDPDNRLFVLVLPESHRHRELQARSELLADMADDAEVAVPDYVANHATVFGPLGLKHLLEQAAVRAMETTRSATERADSAAELDAREKALDRLRSELDRRADELSRNRQLVEERGAALSRRAVEVERQNVELTRQKARLASEGGVNNTVPFEQLNPSSALAAGDTRASLHPSAGEVPVDVDSRTPDPELTDDETIRRWLESNEATLQLVHDGRVRLAAQGEHDVISALVGNRLQVKLLLHRMATYPLITLSVGAAGSLDQPGQANSPLVFVFDIADEGDRVVLSELKKEFAFTLELYGPSQGLVSRRVVRAPLAENVPYLLHAADAHLDSIKDTERSLVQALGEFASMDFDRYALRHPERTEFREGALRQLGRPGDVRRALAVAGRFSKADREEYLLLRRGYPLAQWHQRRRQVISRGVELGLWLGPRLARVAVSEDIARSPKELVATLIHNFGKLVHDGAHGLDGDQVADNWTSLRREAEALGIPASPNPIDSGNKTAVSGTIQQETVVGHRQTADEAPQVPPAERTPTPTPTPTPSSATHDADTYIAQRPEPANTDELVRMLDDKNTRTEAAIELARRGDSAALGPLFTALGSMNRGDAGRVFGSLIGYGAAAEVHLLEALRSRKSFIRQGAALALAMIGSSKAEDALCDLLFDEPTEIWREVSRAIGHLGAGAVMPLISRLRDRGDGGDRVAWALANAAVNGGDKVIKSLARGRDSVAADVARRAQELMADASDQARAVRGAAEAREVTVNRAFSMRFFQALGRQAIPSVLGGSDISEPALLLDESDLLDATEVDADESARHLDERDLLPG